MYEKHLNRNYVQFPRETDKEFNTYHTFVVQVKMRDQLKVFLKKKVLKLRYIILDLFIYNQQQENWDIEVEIFLKQKKQRKY